MDKITLSNFRCFRQEQRVRMAPITLLVGENSTGKTSFMAMVRALWELSHQHIVPDFKREPYDLGSFREVAHYRGGSAKQSPTFSAALHLAEAEHHPSLWFSATFSQQGTIPFPTVRNISDGTHSLIAEQTNGVLRTDVEIVDGPSLRQEARTAWSAEDGRLAPLYWALGSRPDGFSEDQWNAVNALAELPWRHRYPVPPFASAPVRSKPRRTYDPGSPSRDPEGDYVPMYLAFLFRQRANRWNAMKRALEAFGVASGLFDELDIKSPLGSSANEPFQIQIRKLGSRLKGPLRNLTDVGYGVSQALPLITELLRPDDAPPLFLFQQPEVHLHPRAQAALGTLFCATLSDRRFAKVRCHRRTYQSSTSNATKSRSKSTQSRWMSRATY